MILDFIFERNNKKEHFNYRERLREKIIIYVLRFLEQLELLVVDVFRIIRTCLIIFIILWWHCDKIINIIIQVRIYWLSNWSNFGILLMERVYRNKEILIKCLKNVFYFYKLLLNIKVYKFFHNL